jgi:hypothetical protein
MEDAHISWLAQPAQASALPAWSESVPGQCSGAFEGTREGSGTAIGWETASMGGGGSKRRELSLARQERLGIMRSYLINYNRSKRKLVDLSIKSCNTDALFSDLRKAFVLVNSKQPCQTRTVSKFSCPQDFTDQYLAASIPYNIVHA